MSALLCWLGRPCKRLWLFDAMVNTGLKSRSDPLGENPVQAGVYQCRRCKTISLGSAKQ